MGYTITTLIEQSCFVIKYHYFLRTPVDNDKFENNGAKCRRITGNSEYNNARNYEYNYLSLNV